MGPLIKLNSLFFSYTPPDSLGKYVLLFFSLHVFTEQLAPTQAHTSQLVGPASRYRQGSRTSVP